MSKYDRAVCAEGAVANGVDLAVFITVTLCPAMLMPKVLSPWVSGQARRQIAYKKKQ